MIVRTAVETNVWSKFSIIRAFAFPSFPVTCSQTNRQLYSGPKLNVMQYHVCKFICVCVLVSRQGEVSHTSLAVLSPA